MKKIYFILLSIFWFATGATKAQEIIWLYPEGKTPNSKGLKLEDSLSRERYFKIGHPRITIYRPSIDENKGTAVLIIPGGGYNHITYNMAGIQFAKWFNTLGITAFVLYYRLPHSPDLIDRSIAPLQDAQRAMRLIRANAPKWGIKPDAIGVMGTSAGGHVSSSLGTLTEDVSDIKDSLSKYSFRPDFMILVSPVISMTEITHKGSKDKLLGDNPPEELIKKFSNELQVTDKTTPALLIHANDDNAVPVMNSVLFYEALLKHKIPASLHIFPFGGHKIALRNNPGSTALWTEICEKWLNEMGFLEEMKN